MELGARDSLKLVELGARDSLKLVELGARDSLNPWGERLTQPKLHQLMTLVSCRVAVCCSVLQCVAVCCSVLQCVAVCCSVSYGNILYTL